MVVAPAGSRQSRLLLARAVGEEQLSRVGNQTGGRVFLFLSTDDFWRDYTSFVAKGVTFVRPPKEEPYGTVAILLSPPRSKSKKNAEIEEDVDSAIRAS